jgi:sulfur relay protein TusB/DsrH
MLVLISSAPDTREFQTAYKIAKEAGAEICLLQNAVYAASNDAHEVRYALGDDLALRGIDSDNVNVTIINYSQLLDIMTKSEKVVGLF